MGGAGNYQVDPTTGIMTGPNSANPFYFFDSCGIHPVELIVTDEYECADTIINNIEVYCEPTADFSIQDSTCLGDTTVFINNSFPDPTTGGSLSYTWNMGGAGTWISGGPNSAAPHYVYSSHGNKTVTLLVIDSNGCDDTLIISHTCLLYTSPSPRDVEESRMPSSA